jgi:mannose-6-phosphate isomerase-like protein (cupin superfamily)
VRGRRTGARAHRESDLGATKTSGSVDREAALAAFRAEGCGAARSWSNGRGDRYGSHDHGFHKVLFCLEGSIVFHTDQGDVALSRGDRLDLPPRTRHAATVGPAGCACIEAERP